MNRSHDRSLMRLLTLSLVVAVPLAATPAHAMVLNQDPAAEANPDLNEAERLYKLGKARYELFDFPAAIEFWTEAYGLLPEGENARVRNVLVRNLSVAHMKAFEVDEEVKHLKTAKMLLERYVKELTTYYQGEADTAQEIGKANETIAEIDAKLAEIEAKEETPEPSPTPVPTTGDGDGDTTAPGPVSPAGPQVDEEGMHKGRVLMGVGGGLLGLAAVGGGIGTYGAISGQQAGEDAKSVDAPDRTSVLESGRSANVLAYVGAGVGVVSLAVGVALIAVGAKKKNEAKSARFVPSLSPTFSRTGGGASFSLEF